MRGRLLVLAALTSLPCAVFAVACSETRPPPLADSDASLPQADAHEFADPRDAGAPPDEAGVALAKDYGAICDPGKLPVWHFFDFMTHTPGDSSIMFRAQTATSEALLDKATSVELANVTGPDITVWSGVDVEPKLNSIGEKSMLWLRITL